MKVFVKNIKWDYSDPAYSSSRFPNEEIVEFNDDFATVGKDCQIEMISDFLSEVYGICSGFDYEILNPQEKQHVRL